MLHIPYMLGIHRICLLLRMVRALKVLVLRSLIRLHLCLLRCMLLFRHRLGLLFLVLLFGNLRCLIRIFHVRMLQILRLHLSRLLFRQLLCICLFQLLCLRMKHCAGLLLMLILGLILHLRLLITF